MKIGRFVLDPLDKSPDVVVFQYALYCVVVVKQLTLSECSMDLPMAYSMQKNSFFAFKCFRNEVVLAWFLRKRSLA